MGVSGYFPSGNRDEKWPLAELQTLTSHVGRARALWLDLQTLIAI